MTKIPKTLLFLWVLRFVDYGVKDYGSLIVVCYVDGSEFRILPLSYLRLTYIFDSLRLML